MNTADTGSNGSNLAVYLMTIAGTFLTENWYVLIMVIFGAVHVYVAIQNNIRNKKKFDLEMEALKNTP